MKKATYFILDYLLDANINGVEEQQISGLYNTNNLNGIKTDDYNENRQNFIDNTSLDMHNFLMQPKSKLTDLLSSDLLSLDGIFISHKFKELVRLVKIKNTKFYTTTLFLNDKKHTNYSFLNLIDSENIDYKKSTFRVDEFVEKWRDGGEIIEINSKEEIFSKAWNVIMEDATKRILPKKAILKEHLDLFRLANSGTNYCSEHFKNTIENSDLTGIEFKETDIEFYIED